MNLLVVYLEQYRDIWNTEIKETCSKKNDNTGTGTAKLTEVANESQRDNSQKGGSNLGGGTAKTAAPIAEAVIAEIESEFFEEQIRILLATRFKVMHLQMSWKKFMKETP